MIIALFASFGLSVSFVLFLSLDIYHISSARQENLSLDLDFLSKSRVAFSIHNGHELQSLFLMPLGFVNSQSPLLAFFRFQACFSDLGHPHSQFTPLPHHIC